MATTYTVTYPFSTDTTAVATEVNQNFTDVLTALNDFDASNCDDTKTLPLGCISNLTSAQMASTFFLDEDDMVSDSATAVSSQQATKKYIDDQIVAAFPDDDAFGTWSNLDSSSNAYTSGSIYKAPCDGYVRATSNLNYFTFLRTDGSKPPATLADMCHNHSGGPAVGSAFTSPVKKNHYWKVNTTGSTTIKWMPIGTGACVKQ